MPPLRRVVYALPLMPFSRHAFRLLSFQRHASAPLLYFRRRYCRLFAAADATLHSAMIIFPFSARALLMPRY